MHTTHNHWIECPSWLCQEATLLVFQLSKPGKTSLHVGMLRCFILATPFPCVRGFSDSKFTFCTCLLCFPLTLGTWVLPFWGWKTSLGLFIEDDISTKFMRNLSHTDLPPLEWREASSKLLSTSEFAIKSLTVSAVISAADSAACSLKN